MLIAMVSLLVLVLYCPHFRSFFLWQYISLAPLLLPLMLMLLLLLLRLLAFAGRSWWCSLEG